MMEKQNSENSQKIERVLIVNTDLPVFPGRAGHEFLNTLYLKKHLRKLGLVSQVHTIEQEQKKQSLVNGDIDLFVWENPGLHQVTAETVSRKNLFRKIGKLFYEFLLTGVVRPKDTLVQDYQFSNMAQPLVNAFRETNWQGLVVVQSSCSKYIDYVPKFVITALALHDIRALVYERQAEVAKSIFGRLAFRLEAFRYRIFEKKYCQKFDLVITVSASDQKWVEKHYRPNRVQTLVIPVDPGYFSPGEAVQTVPGRIIFTGMMNHQPNVDAVCYYAKEIFPQVKKQIPKAEFWIIGRDPTAEVLNLEKIAGVKVTGFVNDIRPYIEQASLVVVPIRFGSGMRNKILEAWSLQKPVLSSSVGAEGLDYTDGKNLMIADTRKDFINKSVVLLTNQQLTEQIRLSGRGHVQENHNPVRIGNQYFDVLNRVYQEKMAAAPMRVLVDLRWMEPGVAGGIENYSRSFMKELAALDHFNEYKVLLPSVSKYDLDLTPNRNIHFLTHDGPDKYWRKISNRARKFAFRLMQKQDWRSETVEDLGVAHRYGVDLVLSPIGYFYPDVACLKNVIFILDLQHEYFPQFFTHADLEERRRVFGNAIKKSKHLIAISEYTRQCVLEKYNINPATITTVYGAADSFFQPDNSRQVKTERVLEKYGLNGKNYLFFPGNTWPHKNHITAVEALKILRDDHHSELELVCTGSPKSNQSELTEQIAAAGLSSKVHFLGYCPLEDMPGLYKGAQAMIFPSFFEGFGIPLLEAMWCGCPVVCSNVTSIPEIAGDAALYADPNSPEDFAQAVQRLLRDSGLYADLVRKGKARAAQFTWQKFTAEVIQILYDTYRE